jgi:hypothetical protein
VDVLIDARHFIEAGAEQFDPALGEQLLGRASGEGLHRLGATHHAARAVRRAVERLGRTLAAHDVAGRRHRAGDDPEHAGARRRRALAMHDDLAFLAIHDVTLLPREVVVVLDVEDHVRAEFLRDVLVDERVIRRSRAGRAGQRWCSPWGHRR